MFRVNRERQRILFDLLLFVLLPGVCKMQRLFVRRGALQLG